MKPAAIDPAIAPIVLAARSRPSCGAAFPPGDAERRIASGSTSDAARSAGPPKVRASWSPLQNVAARVTSTATKARAITHGVPSNNSDWATRAKVRRGRAGRRPEVSATKKAPAAIESNTTIITAPNEYSELISVSARACVMRTSKASVPKPEANATASRAVETLRARGAADASRDRGGASGSRPAKSDAATASSSEMPIATP